MAADFALTTAFGLGFASSKPRTQDRVRAPHEPIDFAAHMAAAQAGDQARYRFVLEESSRIAARMARQSGVPSYAIDDVVQETLISIHQALATYDPARPFTPWVQAIARRRAVDGLRRLGRVGQREVNDEFAYDSHEDSAPRADTALQRVQEAKNLRAEIAKLPPKQREAIQLLGIEDKDLSEGAEITGGGKTALKVNFFRAIRALRKNLGVGDV